MRVASNTRRDPDPCGGAAWDPFGPQGQGSHMTAKFAKAALDEYLRNQPLAEFFVAHHSITEEQINQFRDCLSAAKDEKPLQALFELNPTLLVQHLRASGRFVLPQKRLGAEFVPDFVVGEHHSFGYDWQLIELESPNIPLFTKAGDPRAELTHAIRQIQDWRAWLQRNQNYASRSRAESGLGLTDITANVSGLIIMGRRSLLDPETNDRRRQMVADLNIDIHTYDYLLDRVQAAVAA